MSKIGSVLDGSPHIQAFEASRTDSNKFVSSQRAALMPLLQVMNNIREQLERVDFCDGQIERVELLNGEIVLIFKNRQGIIFRLRFKGVIYFKSFEFGGDISEVQVGNGTEEIGEAIRIIDRDGGSVKTYSNLVQATFISDAPVMMIVFQEFQNES